MHGPRSEEGFRWPPKRRPTKEELERLCRSCRGDPRFAMACAAMGTATGPPAWLDSQRRSQERRTGETLGSYDRTVPWRAKCYECGQVVGITRPVFETASSFAAGNLQAATASYEAHARKPGDSRFCSSVSKVVPQYQMREAYSTTPGEDLPTPRRLLKVRRRRGKDDAAQ